MICSSMSRKTPGRKRAGSQVCRCMPAKWRVERHFASLARKNLAAGDHPFFLGSRGIQASCARLQVDHLIQRGEFLTAYTPYQPRKSRRGTLQMLFEFQTQVARLFGCDVANASMYDGSTAPAGKPSAWQGRITKRKKGDIVAGAAAPALCQCCQNHGQNIPAIRSTLRHPELSAGAGYAELSAAR